MLFTVPYFERCNNRGQIISRDGHLGFKCTCTESNLMMSIKFTFGGRGGEQFGRTHEKRLRPTHCFNTNPNTRPPQYIKTKIATLQKDRGL